MTNRRVDRLLQVQHPPTRVDHSRLGALAIQLSERHRPLERD
jgi:hypothetical protein